MTIPGYGQLFLFRSPHSFCELLAPVISKMVASMLITGPENDMRNNHGHDVMQGQVMSRPEGFGACSVNQPIDWPAILWTRSPVFSCRSQSPANP